MLGRMTIDLKSAAPSTITTLTAASASADPINQTGSTLPVNQYVKLAIESQILVQY